MKKLSSLLLVLIVAMGSLVTLSSFTASPEYFEGKWAVTVYDTPQGTATIPMRFETKDGKTMGYFVEDPSGTEKEMSSVTITDDVLTAYFNITGYDVYISLKKVDEESASGSLMDMFVTEAKKVK
ncbi:MAG: hypothetical protein EP311_09640 [Cytophagales bacterium]|uniref:Uncharacterized protein n=1 Tax=Algoriphagus taiwanensis TaxID=1445656 RepID=A0ABQ6Q099_9BACT|nr:MAG: hypothetical protein EP311_09640 [Cytophagales bacterium]GMQ32935.1 hypothetical protein Ataiwa_12070 [Algoriphagus taiwanensis]